MDNRIETIDCQLFHEMIFLYLDDNLTDEATACFLEHARTCPECRAALEEARSFEFGLIGAFTNMDPPYDLADRVMADLHKPPRIFEEPPAVVPRKKKFRFSRRSVFGAVGTIAAAAALVFAVNLAVGAPGTEPEDLAVADNGVGQGMVAAGETARENSFLARLLGGEDDTRPLGDVLNDTALQNDTIADSVGVYTAERRPISSLGNDINSASKDRPNNNSGGSDRPGGSQPNHNDRPSNNEKPNNQPSNNDKPNNNEQPGNNDQPNNKPDNNNPSTDPDDNQNTDEITLPEASYGTETVGTLNQRLIAAYDEESVYMPSVSLDNQTVSYYTTIGDTNYLWKADLVNAEEPKCVGPVGSSSVTLSNTTPVYTRNTSIFSPDMSMLSMNARGDKKGIWISNLLGSGELTKISEEGGGDLLAWAPDSSKFVFTNSEGDLLIAYPIEKRIVSVYTGEVKDIAWGSDSRTLVFTNEESNGERSLYTVQIP